MRFHLFFASQIKYACLFSLIIRDKHHGPTLAVIECPNAHLMKSGVPALDDFPCVSIPSNARDSQYQVI